MPWLLNFTDPNFNAPTGNGRPWADGTEMASRAQPGAANPNPWDNNCLVTTYVDGLSAMSAMRNELEAVIAAANAPGAPAVGQRGHVYIADWRFNGLRDLSTNNPWAMDAWAPGQVANPDQTAIGLVVRLLQAGVRVRIMLWLPTAVQAQVVGNAHVQDHYWAAKVVRDESNRIAPALNPPLGVVALDMRTAGISLPAASHHQKMMVIRSANTNVAFVGGVDLAYTRRSNLTAGAAPAGDWQSANSIPDPAQPWPHQAGVAYGFLGVPALPGVPALTITQAADLPANVYGDSAAPGVRQLWHDQHLKLEGPVVATIEQQFAERWVDQVETTARLFPPALGVPKLYDLTTPANYTSGQVIFSTAAAYNGGAIVALPQPQAVPALAPGAGASRVQMWRTIPLRTRPNAALFTRGEFTVMAGISNAVQQATELIWMYDQYFWSKPLARQLNARLVAQPGLRMILILPPFADASPGDAHLARRLALELLTANGVVPRVGVYNMWYRAPGAGAGPAVNRGIYVHAKSHTYDDQLLVCGSANLNRRSFLCDTELACAVLDNALVHAHQQQQWAQLFPNTLWPAPPAVNYGAPGWGAQFFTQFQAAQAAAALAGDYRLIQDPWAANGPLPNGVVRPVSAFLGADYATAMDPASVTLLVENDPPQLVVEVPLDRIVTRLENTPNNNWEWRHW